MKKTVCVLLCLALTLSLIPAGLISVSAEAVPVVFDYRCAFNDESENLVVDAFSDAEGYVSSPDFLPEYNDEGLRFYGWYTSTNFAFSEPFDFNLPVEQQTTFYARWIDEDDVITVTLYDDPDADAPCDYRYLVAGDYFYDPEAAQKEDKTFYAWYTDRNLKQMYYADILNTDITLYARYVNEEDILGIWIYLDKDAAEYTSGVDVVKGDCFNAPADPGREGEVFAGWYTDRELNRPFDPNVPVMADINLYPKFIPENEAEYISVYIYLDPGDAEYTAAYELVKGRPVPAPGAPGSDGMTLDGWFLDRQLSVPFVANTEYDHDISLYPKFTPIEGSYRVGDADGDGEVTIIDATAIQRHLATLPTKAFQPKAADADCDGEVMILDATEIQRWLAELPTAKGMVNELIVAS